MNITLLHGYPDRVGRRARWCGYGNGPTSYTGGTTPTDSITGLPFKFYIDNVDGNGISVSGNYYVIAQPAGVGPRQTWFLRYYTATTGAEVSSSTNLSAEQFQLSGDGGFY